jgi:plastocyanin
MRSHPIMIPARLVALSLLVLAAGRARAEDGTVTGQVIVQPGRFQDETVVYLVDAIGPASPMTHELDQKNMKFRPYVLAIAVGDTVSFLNHDGVEHSVYSPDGEPFDLGAFPSGATRSHAFRRLGAATILCRVHPEMLGYVFVAPGHHAAALDRAGRFTLAGVPAGVHRLAVWNAHLPGAEQDVTVAAGQTVEITFTLRR